MSKKTYDASSIQVLEDLEHIRTRPGMYIGSQDSDGIRQILKEVVDNTIDEYLEGHATHVSVEVNTEDHTFVVADDGRGIPIEVHPKTGESTLITVFTNLQAGGKFNKQSYAVSAGLHGVGLKATNALSSWLEVQVWRKGRCYECRFEQGAPSYPKPKPVNSLNKKGRTGTTVTFHPDPEIFGSNRVVVDQVRTWLQETSHLCPGLKVTLSIDEETEVFQSSGLGDLVKERAATAEALNDPLTFESATVSASFLWVDNEDSAGDSWFSACNASATPEGGRHVEGALKAIEDVLKPFAKSKKLDKRDLVDGLHAAIHVLVAEPQFKSQTKEKLLNPDVKEQSYDFLYPLLKSFFDSNKKLADTLVSRALQLKKARESYKKLRAAVGKSTPKKKTARGILPGKLVESIHCLPTDRELFVAEGDSAGGSAKSARDPDYQEILPLRGKIPNASQWSLPKLLANEEISSLLSAMGITLDPKTKKEDLSELRISRLLLLMDADPDGQHIVSLVLTFLVRWLPEFVRQGYVYIVDSPLFVGLYKEKRYYGHSLRDVEVQAGVPSSKFQQVSRLKGHGECLDGSSLVSTSNKGLVSIREIYGGDDNGWSPVKSPCTVPSKSSVSDEVIETFSKTAETYKVSTRYGYNLVGTSSHKFLSIKNGIVQWIRLSDLSPGDFVAMDRRQMEQGIVDLPALLPSPCDLPDEVPCPLCGDFLRDLRSHINFSHEESWDEVTASYPDHQMFSSSSAITSPTNYPLPTVITPELCRLLGYLIGDGSVTTSSFTIHHGVDQDAAEDSNSCFQLCFPGVNAKTYSYVTDNGVTAWNTTVTSVVISRFMWECCGLSRTTAHHKKVPSCILSAPNSMVAHFLRGYFDSDGWSETHNSPKIGVYTASELLADQVRLLLLRFGIVSKGSFGSQGGGFSDENTTGTKLYLEGSNVPLFWDHIGFVSDRKKDRTHDFAKGNTNDDVIPGMKEAIISVRDDCRLGSKGCSWYSTSNGKERLSFGCYTSSRELTYQYLDVGDNLSNIREALGLCKPDLLASLDWVNESRPFWDKIKDISPAGTRKVYDISVDQGHSYSANGFMVHNSSAEELRHYAMNPDTRKLWRISLAEGDQEFIMSLMGSDSSEKKKLLGLN